MAEYLNEEDMNTGEYISRDLALKQLNGNCLATDCDNYNGVRCRVCAYADAMDFIDDIPAEDVQPVDTKEILRHLDSLMICIGNAYNTSHYLLESDMEFIEKQEKIIKELLTIKSTKG